MTLSYKSLQGLDPSQLGMGMGDAEQDQKTLGGIPYTIVAPSPGMLIL